MESRPTLSFLRDSLGGGDNGRLLRERQQTMYGEVRSS
jgi:hypothetical protein